jgi:HK97 family phage prohead protease
MEHKSCGDAQLKILNMGKNGGLSGYASTFANFDRVNERPVKGAFSGTLARFKQDGFIAVGHDWSSLPVATVTDAYEDEHGLFLEAEFHSTPLAQEARTIAQERIDRGKSVSLSIGYDVKADEFVEEGRLLKEVDLFEVSLVNVPANPLATVTGVKSLLQASMPLDAHSEVAQAAIEGYMKRLEAISAKHKDTKEGRVLSGANRTKLTTLHSSLADVMQAIEELLAATEPKATEEETRKAHADFLRLMNRQRTLLNQTRS